MAFLSRKGTYDSYTLSISSSRTSRNGSLYRKSSNETIQSYQESISNSSVHTTSTVATRKDLLDRLGQGSGGDSDPKSLHAFEKPTFGFRNQSQSTIGTIREAGIDSNSTPPSTPKPELRSLDDLSFEDEVESSLPSTPRFSVHGPSKLPDLSPRSSYVYGAPPSTPPDDPSTKSYGFPLPPGVANPRNPSNSDSEPTPRTPQAIPSVDRSQACWMDRLDSPTTPTPNAYCSRSSSTTSTYQSVITEQESLVQCRALPLLLHDLPYTRINVTKSSMRSNDLGKGVLSFVILVDPGNQKEQYMVEKSYSDVLQLDKRIRSRCGKSVHKKIPHLPDRKLWKDHAPSRVDQRKAELKQYVQGLINLPVKSNDEIIAFLTSDVIKEANKPVAREGYKEGYLTKRGRNFGGWKTRFFVLQGPQLEYYESRGGLHLGTISITGAQIGRQNPPAVGRESEEEGEYRRAFIIEPKIGTGGSHRHVLCAESDCERDSWVEILVRYVSGAYDEHASWHTGSSVYVNRSASAPATTSVSSSQPRSSTCSNAPVEPVTPPRDRRQAQRGVVKEDIKVISAVALSQFALDLSNPNLFQRQEKHPQLASTSEYYCSDDYCSDTASD